MMWFARASPERLPEWRLQSAARTHIGKVRTVNEDRILDCPEERLWAVADGMGGHSRGDRAATGVVRALASLTSNAITSAAIGSALNAANVEILAHSLQGETCGSTVAGLHIDAGLCTLFWAGDSRIYRLRRKRLQLLSHDHSYVQQLTDAGLITPDQARSHPQANVITRAVGIGPHLEIDYAVCELMDGDIFLLCSDGLSSMVDDERIARLMQGDLRTAAEGLVESALQVGGTDNISLILVHAQS